MTADTRINILEVRSCRGGGGGPEKTILFSALEADREKFRVHIVYLRSEDDPEFDLDRRAAKLGVESFETISERRRFDLAAIRRLREICRERRIDVFHAHCYKSDLYGLIVRRSYPMVLMTTAHGPLATMKFFWASKNWLVRYGYDQIDLRILKYFDLVLMVSDTMRSIIGRYGVSPEKLIWIRNAIDSRYFSRNGQRRAAFRTQHHLPADAVVIGAVGRLNGEKDYPNLLRAADLIVRKRPNVYFVIVGKGELDQELREMSTRLGLDERVTFLGHFHDVREVFEAMDLYVLSSTREGLPNTVLEAMAMEAPIVSTDVDGVKEAVTHDQEALLVPAQDSAALAAGIETLLDDPTMAARLARAARQRVETEFSFVARTRKVERIYEDLVAKRGAR